MSQSTIPLETSESPATQVRTGAGMTMLGALAGFGAVFAAASCCVLPLALVALGLGTGLSSTFTALMPLRWPLTALSILGLGAGWYFYARRRRACSLCTAPGFLDTRLHYAARLRLVSRCAARASRGLR
jgi:mercuric ion transport protein